MSANEETVDPSSMDATHSCQGACSRDTPRLTASAIAEALKTRPLWRLTPEGTAISRRFTSKNWAAAMGFFNVLMMLIGPLKTRWIRRKARAANPPAAQLI